MGEKKKIVIDTNILISAFGWEGKPKKLLDKVVNGEFELILSHSQFKELERVLHYPRLEFDEGKTLRFLEIISAIATFVKVSGELHFVKDDPDDDMIVEAALEYSAIIISGDDHLLSLKLNKIKVYTVADFLKIL
tara:strand:+ start:2058 stop:2462 length:405 start_codon:yes stop_codon:yes gene_type:complete